MTAPTVYTYYDVIESLKDFCSGHGFSAKQEVLRRAAVAAVRELVAVRDWKWLYKQGRIPLEAAYTTGTVEYDHTGGTYERELTLTDGTWPDWIEDGMVRFDSIVCEVESRKSDTVITLDVQRNPGADVAAGETYSAYRTWYSLPNDFVALWAPLEETSWLRSQYRPFQDIAAFGRYETTTGDVNYYAIGHGDGLYGSYVLYVSWPSDAAETLDIPYKRQPRTLRYTGHDGAESQGTISVTAGSDAVSCTGTDLSSKMIGSILRIGDSSNRPTGLEGHCPYDEQRTIIDVSTGSTQTMTLDAAVSTSQSGVAYTISDPVDLPVMAYEAFLRGAEKHLSNAYRKATDAPTLAAIRAAYEDALAKAKGADSVIRQRRFAGNYQNHSLNLSNATNVYEVE